MTDGAKDVPVKTHISGYREINIPVVVTLQGASARDIPVKVTLQGDGVKDVPVAATLEVYRVDYGLYGESIYETAPRETIFYAQGGTPDKSIATTDPYWFIKSGTSETGKEGFMEMGFGQNDAHNESDANLAGFVRVQLDGTSGEGEIKIKPVMWFYPSAEPTTDQEGMIYYDSTAQEFKFYNGSAWGSIGGGGGGPGSGTQWTLPVWDTTSTLGDSMIAQDSGGTTATVTGDLTITNDPAVFTITDTSTARSMTITMATSTTDPVIFQTNNAYSFVVDSTERIGIDDGGVITLNGSTLLPNELDMTGTLACIDLNPAGTSSANIIDITPTAALNNPSGTAFWRGLAITPSSLDPTTTTTGYVYGVVFNASAYASVDGTGYTAGLYHQPPVADNSYALNHVPAILTADKTQSMVYSSSSIALGTVGTYRGVLVDWSGMTAAAGTPNLRPLEILMPATYTNMSVYAANFTGDGRSVLLCDTSYAISSIGNVLLDNANNVTVNATTDAGAYFFITSTEIAVLTVEGDRDNDDETKHAYASFEQDGGARWTRIGVGQENDDNLGFIASYEALEIFIGGTFPSGTRVAAFSSTQLTLDGDLTVSGGDITPSALLPTTTFNCTDTSLVADQSLGKLIWYGNDGSADGVGVYAQIETKASRDIVGGFRDGYLSFSTSVGLALTEQMTLDKNGNLSIGGDLTVTGGNIISANGLWTSLAGAQDGYIWAVSGAYPNYGLYYNTGSPDYMEWHWVGAVKAAMDMETGSLQLDGNLVVSGDTTSTFAGSVQINETGAGPYLSLGTVGDTTDPMELLRFNIERAWSFRKRSTGASTRLSLEADNDGKLFQIGFDDGVVYAAKFSIHDAQEDCSVTLAHNVTVDGDLAIASKFELSYNSTSESLDFNYIG